jgi:hypothetical protein
MRLHRYTSLKVYVRSSTTLVVSMRMDNRIIEIIAMKALRVKMPANMMRCAIGAWSFYTYGPGIITNMMSVTTLGIEYSK